MKKFTDRWTRLAPVLFAGALSLGCERTLVAPEADDGVRPNLSAIQSGFVVVNVQLRPAAESDATIWGELTFFFGVLTPPSPVCEHGVLDATVAVCGVIHNPDLQSLEGGGFDATLSNGQVIRLRFAVPPSPICPTYQVRAAASVPLTQISPGPPNIAVFISTSAGLVVGVNPGPPETSPGPPDDRAQPPGPPDCELTFTGG